MRLLIIYRKWVQASRRTNFSQELILDAHTIIDITVDNYNLWMTKSSRPGPEGTVSGGNDRSSERAGSEDVH